MTKPASLDWQAAEATAKRLTAQWAEDQPGGAVIGFDDLPIAAYTRPALTTIHNPAIEQGEAAARMLIRLLNREVIERPRVVFGTELVIRASSGGRVG